MITTARPAKAKWSKKAAIVFSNQSNARGTSVVGDYPTNMQGASNYLLEYKHATNELVAVQAGVNNSYITRAQDTALTGPGVVIQKYLSYLNRNLFIVPLHRGGAGLNPYSSSYFNHSEVGGQGARAILQSALEFSEDDTTFLVIFSGENESEPSGAVTTEVFQGLLEQEIADFRDACVEVKGAGHKVCVVIMGVHDYAAATNASAIRAAQQAVAAADECAEYIDTNYLSQTSVHFTYNDYVSLTKKIAAAIRRMKFKITTT